MSIYVPVVASEGVSVGNLYRVEASHSPPLLAVSTVARSVVPDVVAVAVGLDPRRHEKPPNAYLMAHSERACNSQATITGNSCLLGMALASLVQHLGHSLAKEVVCTGNLCENGKVAPVEHLSHKADVVAREAAERSHHSWLFLVPHPESEPSKPERPPNLPDNVDWQPVRTVFEACRLIGLDVGESSANISLLRGRIYELRMEVEKAAQRVVELCAELWTAAQELQKLSPARLILEHEAYSIASLAMSKAEHTGRRDWNWGEGSINKVAAREAARELRERHLESLPVDQVAAEWNFEAVELGLLGSAQFLGGIWRVDNALALPGLRGGLHGERRRLLGTRAQLFLRQAMRETALGNALDATSLMRRAGQDAAEALGQAEQSGAQRKNDLDRVRLYAAQCSYLWELLGHQCDARWPLKPAEYYLKAVLGCFYAGERGAELPEQDPIWGLVTMYTGWAHAGRYAEVKCHWETVSAWRMGGAEASPAEQLRPVESGGREIGPAVPAVRRVAGVLCRASVATESPELGRSAAQFLLPTARHPVTLLEQLLVLPALRWADTFEPGRGGEGRSWLVESEADPAWPPGLHRETGAVAYNTLRESAASGDWHTAEQAARMLHWLIGEMDPYPR